MSSHSLAMSDAPKAMSFRTTVRQHELMTEAAKTAEVSLNTWMKAQLDKAIATVSPQSVDLPPAKAASIRELLRGADEKIELVDALVGFVKDSSPKAILHFSNALNPYLIGLDAIRPYWQRATYYTQTVRPSQDAELAANSTSFETHPEGLTRSLVFLLQGFNQPDDFAEATQFGDAIRLYMTGWQVIFPFLKGEPEVTAVEFLKVVEAFLVKLEGDGGQLEPDIVLNVSNQSAQKMKMTQVTSTARGSK